MTNHPNRSKHGSGIIVGTAHFPSTRAAEAYYRTQDCTTDRQARQLVATKIAEGLIHIGPPPLKEGERLTLIDGNRRYAIIER